MACPIKLHNDVSGDKQEIVFCCDMCSIADGPKGDIVANRTCRGQIIRLLPFLDAYMPARFQSENHTFRISAEVLSLLREYAVVLKNNGKRVERICEQYPELRDHLYSDPLTTFEILENISEASLSHDLRNLFAALRRIRLYSLTKSLPITTPEPSYSTIYDILFRVKEEQHVPTVTQPIGQLTILDCYNVGPFMIKIADLMGHPFEKLYHVSANIEAALSAQIIRFLASQLKRERSDEDNLLSLDEVMSGRIQDFRKFLSASFTELTEAERDNLAIFAMAQLLDLTKTMPLLLDDEVQEFYLDRPGEPFYLDHARWGRCITNLVPLNSELTRLVTRLRLESRRPLDETMPSLKTELRTRFFHVRAAIDIPPLAHDGLHLNIRKLRLRLMTLPELIDIGTLTIPAAAFLVLCMTQRINITICGEPSSGKTTLANALNMVAPPFWRQIAIEDALEGIPANVGRRHRVTFKVDPFDSLDKKRHTKSDEIIRLLHRSPDWVFLGEIQTAEHSNAMFHALSAGIRGIQTCHAGSPNELLLRWQVHHKIPEICFRSLGLIVHMIRDISCGRIRRRVAQICETEFRDEKPTLWHLFEWNKETEQLEQVCQDIITPLLIRSCRYEQITENDLRRRFDLYEATLTRLVMSKIYDPEKVVEAFDETYTQTVKAGGATESSNLRKPTPAGGDIIRTYDIAA